MTKQTLGFGLALLVTLALGWWGRGLVGDDAQPQMPATMSSGGACPDGAEPLYWKAPMDPTYVREAPGKSPMGMDLVPACPGSGAPTSDGTIEIDPQTIQKIGVRTAVVSRQTLSRSIRAVGRVAYDERRVEHIHTKVQGWVEVLHADFVGQQVRRGQPLLEVYSPELHQLSQMNRSQAAQPVRCGKPRQSRNPRMKIFA